MIKKFDVEFLEESLEFLKTIDEKARAKLIFNIDKAKYLNSHM